MVGDGVVVQDIGWWGWGGGAGHGWWGWGGGAGHRSSVN